MSSSSINGVVLPPSTGVPLLQIAPSHGTTQQQHTAAPPLQPLQQQGHAPQSVPSSSVPQSISAEMQALLVQRKQIRDWQVQVNARIHVLEERYLDESSLGNVIKGWDQDAKVSQKKLTIDEKERLFSNSSLHVFRSDKASLDQHSGALIQTGQAYAQKGKKRKT